MMKITQLENEVQTHPEKRQAQKLQAQEVTTFVHGASAAQADQKISTILFEGNVTQLSVGQLEQAFTKMPAITISDQATNIVDWLVNNQLEPPKRQAHENISQGAIWINGQRIQDLNFWVDPHSNFASQYVLVRKGKKNYTLAQVQSQGKLFANFTSSFYLCFNPSTILNSGSLHAKSFHFLLPAL